MSYSPDPRKSANTYYKDGEGTSGIVYGASHTMVHGATQMVVTSDESVNEEGEAVKWTSYKAVDENGHTIHETTIFGQEAI